MNRDWSMIGRGGSDEIRPSDGDCYPDGWIDPHTDVTAYKGDSL